MGRIGIELPEVLKDDDSRDNLLLQDGDSVFIPRYNSVVNVRSAVNSPVSVTYLPGRSMEYYIRAAGGPSRRAREKRAYVTQPNGKVDARESNFFFRTATPSRSRGAVYVPEEGSG